jgi:hypothetical protein
MKVAPPHSPAERGSVLFVTLITTAILGLGLASYLRMVSTQNYSVARSQAWNRAIPVLEAGIEEALGQINRSIAPSSFAANGWTLTGTNYVKQVNLGTEYAIVKVSTAARPVIEAEGFSPIPLATGEYVSRRVRATTIRTSRFTKAMSADGVIQLNGNNVRSDSFDSSNPSYSTGGMYDPAKRRANGDVATNGDLIDVGNADIMGRVSTGPGGGVQIRSNGSVGDLAWHAGGNSGIQPGYATDDMNVNFPEVIAPYTIGLPPMSGIVNGSLYGYVLSGEGTQYALSSLSMNGSGTQNKIMVTGNVSLYVGGNVSIGGSSSIIIATNASLRLYVAGASTSIGGNGVANQHGYATNFSYYGLPSNTSVSFGGNASFTGTIYAPQANLTLNGGGGSTVYDFVGASVSRTSNLRGNFSFHYDEALGRTDTEGLFVIASWNEF